MPAFAANSGVPRPAAITIVSASIVPDSVLIAAGVQALSGVLHASLQAHYPVLDLHGAWSHRRIVINRCSDVKHITTAHTAVLVWIGAKKLISPTCNP